MADPIDAASRPSPVNEDRTRRPVDVPVVGWVPRPLEDVFPGIAGLAFMAAGLLIWLLFWFAVDEPPQGLAKWGPAGFAALFFSAGVFLARMGFRAPRWWADRRFRGGTEPWGQRYQWSRIDRPLPPQRSLRPVDRGIGLAMLLALLGVINLVWADLESVSGSVWVVYLVIPLASVVMLAVLVFGVWGILVQLREGRGALHFDAGSYPARRGGVLSAEYERGARQAHLQGVVATLFCLEVDLGPTRRTPAAFAVYSQAREFDAGQNVGGRSRTSLMFALPLDAPPTDLERPQGRRCWFLQVVDRDTEGTSLAEPETFLVPVY
jgi:hypothetical protein